MRVLVLFALCFGGGLAAEDEACTTPLIENGAEIAGGALLQKTIQKSAIDASGHHGKTGKKLFEFGSATCGSLRSGHQGCPTCWHEGPGVQHRLNLLATISTKAASNRTTGGADAPLDATGFKDTTSECCPVQMEIFFTRLLDSLDYEICSFKHVQGLMHWFTCVPDMDYEYVLTIIANGNPCKYWAPKGQTCPTLSPECQGKWCEGPAATTPPPATTTPTAATTGPPDTCTDPVNGKSKDIMIMLDASKSVAQEGWAAEADFTKRLIGEIMAQGNPNEHALNVQWFNAVTTPIGEASEWSANGLNLGRFSIALQPLLDALTAVDYASIRAGSSDHPQVYLTSEAAFQSPATGQRAGTEKVLVLITDGESHKGEGCNSMDIATVEAKIGKCSGNSAHVCSPRGCDLEKCMCGVYTSAIFKEQGYELVVVGIANQNHVGDTEAGVFEEIMKAVATPGEAFIAANFDDLEAIVSAAGQKVCD